MGSSATHALIFILTALSQLYILVLLLRLLMPWMGIPFNNPISQGILRLTSPLVVPVRRILPPVGKVDTATLLVAFAIQYLLILVICLIVGWSPRILPIAITAAVELVILTVRLFIFAIIIRVVLSWIGSNSYNPAVALIDSITEPVLRPFRRIVPPLGGFDLSPLFAIILLMALTILIEGLRPLPI